MTDFILLSGGGASGSGAQGPQGPTGSGGVQGATGTNGAQGSTGTTGTQGSTGTGGAQGATGSGGAQGSAGTTGAQGATGAGVQGATGSGGPQGATGTTGAQGSTGTTGAQGSTGNTGVQGARGATGGVSILFTFSTGTSTPASNNGQVNFNSATFGSITHAYLTRQDKNATDVTNTEALVGVGTTMQVWNESNPAIYAQFTVTASVQNTNYYDFTVTPLSGQVLANLTNSAFSFSLKGAQGATGNQGAQGDTGVQGSQGPGVGTQGPQGTQGTQGSTGAQGATGAQGNQGTQGTQGATGAQNALGFSGVQGPPLYGFQGTNAILAGTTNVTVQGMQVSLPAAGTYIFETCMVAQGPTGASGIQWGMQAATAGNANQATNMTYILTGFQTNAINTLNFESAIVTGPAGFATHKNTGVQGALTMTGSVITNGACYLAVQGKGIQSDSTVTNQGAVLAGSYMIVSRLS